MKKALLIGVIFFIVLNPVLAQTNFNQVISNSEDWRDVYSSMLYAKFNNVDSEFLVSTKHGTIILNEIRNDKKIMVTTSEDLPYVFNYPSLIESQGFTDVQEISAENLNLRLVEELEDINNFIIIDDAYGFDAIAVAPYATLTNSWVFFADNLNIFEIDDILNRRDIENIIIYGYIDRDVREVLAKYNPETIDEGDRFQNNIEIVKKYREINPTKQIILSNGEFIEKEIMSGGEPVLFTGKENVPDLIRDYLKNSDIEVGVLIGNDLVGAATNIRRTTGISVMVKFARGARGQTGGIAAIEGLDLFPVPTPSISLSLYSIVYNRASSQIEITYKSDSNLPIYIRGTVTISSDDGTIRIGDEEPIFIAPGDYKTITYSLDSPLSGSLTAEISTLFGESKSSLDRILEGTINVGTVDIIDRCKFDEESIRGAKYNKQKKSFLIKIKNAEEIDCWTDLEIEDIIIDSAPTTLGTEGNILIPSGKTKTITIKEELANEDIEDNPMVNLVIYSGEKEDSLVNVLKGRFPLETEFLSLSAYLIITAIIIILILIIIIIKRRRDEDD